MKNLKLLILLLALSLLSACAQKGIDLSSGQVGSLVRFDRESFLELPTDMVLKLDFLADGSEILLNRPAERLRVSYQIPFNAHNIYIRETNHHDYNDWAINRLLVQGEDYFWDQKTNELFLFVGAPAYYLLLNNFAYTYHLEIISNNNTKISQTKSIALHWKPLDEVATEKASTQTKNLVYFESLAEAAKVMGKSHSNHVSYSHVRDQFLVNLTNSQPTRLAPKLCNQVAEAAQAMDVGKVICSDE